MSRCEEPTDDCNWVPLKAVAKTHDQSLLCGLPCVQHFDMRVAGKVVRVHRCRDHKLAEEFIGRLQQGSRT